MLALIPDVAACRPVRVLCLGAHCDDIEIGCGATLRELQGGGATTVRVDWVVLSGTDLRRRESRRSMRLIVRDGSRGLLHFADFPDGRFPAHYEDIKNYFESLKTNFQPDVIFCHERNDLHQDHRIVNEMVWNSFRDQLILEYEIPKWDGGLGHPNVFVPVSEKHARLKADSLVKAYGSQTGRNWFTRDTFLAILRLRGVECRSPSGYAEAFHGRKISVRV